MGQVHSMKLTKEQDDNLYSRFGKEATELVRVEVSGKKSQKNKIK